MPPTEVVNGAMSAEQAMNYIASELQARAIDPAMIAMILMILLPLIQQVIPNLPCPPTPPTPTQLQAACKRPSLKLYRAVSTYLTKDQGMSPWEAAQAGRALIDVGASAPEEVIARVLAG